MGLESYQCRICKDVLRTKFSFIEHQNIHSGENPFKCPTCGKCFPLLKRYVLHMTLEHAHKIQLYNSKKESYKIKSDSVFQNVKPLEKNGQSKHSSILNMTDDPINPMKINEASIISQKQNKDNYNCDICKIDFKSLQNIKVHQAEVHNCVCEKCNKPFLTSEKLKRHIYLCSKIWMEFKCSCFKTFTNAEEFKSHIGSKPFSCCRCFMKFRTVTNLTRHIRTHTKQRPFVCKDCGRGFSQSAHLRNHSSVHLGVSAIKCNKCDFSCKTYNGLLKHKKKHLDGHNKEENEIDVRNVSTDKIPCPMCSKQFFFKRNMVMHMKVHSGKVCLCSECGKVFTSQGKLTSHYKACHREPSICKTCGKIFASAVLLRYHEKIHVNKKAFTCNICQKTFSIKNYLIQHIKTHSNKKQFSCSKCGKLFKVAVSLKYHNNICTIVDL